MNAGGAYETRCACAFRSFAIARIVWLFTVSRAANAAGEVSRAGATGAGAGTALDLGGFGGGAGASVSALSSASETVSTLSLSDFWACSTGRSAAGGAPSALIQI